MKKKFRPLALTFIIVPIVFIFILILKNGFLIPRGYELAIDGYVISRTLVMIFAAYLLTKLGYFILNNTKED